jgi:hypothetical protein
MRCILHRSFIFTAIFLASVSNAYSSEVDALLGARVPVFLAAVGAWLDDNDVDSLPILSSLANGGNVAARLLPSRIETTDRASGDYVKRLSRKERLNLFRP